MDSRVLPGWAEDLRRRYLRNEASMFVLHGNVYDVVLFGGKMLSLSSFLTDVPPQGLEGRRSSSTTSPPG